MSSFRAAVTARKALGGTRRAPRAKRAARSVVATTQLLLIKGAARGAVSGDLLYGGNQLLVMCD